MKDKLKLLDLSKDFTITRYDDNDEDCKKHGAKPRHQYTIDPYDGDIYAVIHDDGDIEYWGSTGEYYDFKINIEKLNKLIDYVNCLRGDNNEKDTIH